MWDLEEGLKEKDEVINARTAAVGLASASLSADTLDQLKAAREIEQGAAGVEEGARGGEDSLRVCAGQD